MEESQSTPRPTLRTGKICYLEIPAIDIQQSVAFYQRAFGWNIRYGDSDRPSFDDTTGEVGGAWVTDRTPDPDPGILIWIMVADAERAAVKVTEAGGTMHRPVADYGGEVLGTFLDPAGNQLGIYQQPGLAESDRKGERSS